MDMATIFGRYERANGRLDDMEVSDEINACSVEIEVDVDGIKEPWLLMFKNEPTITQLRLNHLVGRQLVSVEPFVIRCQVAHMSTKPCVSRVQVILQHQSLKRVLVNCHNRLFLKQRLMVILHMVTRLGLQRPTFVSISTQALWLNAWS